MLTRRRSAQGIRHLQIHLYLRRNGSNNMSCRCRVSSLRSRRRCSLSRSLMPCPPNSSNSFTRHINNSIRRSIFNRSPIPWRRRRWPCPILGCICLIATCICQANWDTKKRKGKKNSRRVRACKYRPMYFVRHPIKLLVGRGLSVFEDLVNCPSFKWTRGHQKYKLYISGAFLSISLSLFVNQTPSPPFFSACFLFLPYMFLRPPTYPRLPTRRLLLLLHLS